MKCKEIWELKCVDRIQLWKLDNPKKSSKNPQDTVMAKPKFEL